MIALREALRVAKRMTDAAPLCGMPGVANLYREAAAVIESLCTALQEPAPVVQPEITRRVAEWAATDEGKAAIADALRKAEESCERLAKARRVTPEQMNTPIGAAAPSQLVEDARAYLLKLADAAEDYMSSDPVLPSHRDTESLLEARIAEARKIAKGVES